MVGVEERAQYKRSSRRISALTPPTARSQWGFLISNATPAPVPELVRRRKPTAKEVASRVFSELKQSHIVFDSFYAAVHLAV
jgi:hypothetical protein